MQLSNFGYLLGFDYNTSASISVIAGDNFHRLGLRTGSSCNINLFIRTVFSRETFIYRTIRDYYVSSTAALASPDLNSLADKAEDTCYADKANGSIIKDIRRISQSRSAGDWYKIPSCSSSGLNSIYCKRDAYFAVASAWDYLPGRTTLLTRTVS